MRRCKICKVPLEGLLSKISEFLFKVKPSDKDPEICNKCIDKKPSGKHQKYQCQICGRMIDEDRALMHIKAEEYLISLIKKDHPQWKDKDITCQECIDYYRKLVQDAEI